MCKTCDTCMYHVLPPSDSLHCYNYAGYGEACDGYWLASPEEIEEGRRKQLEEYEKYEKEHPIRMTKKSNN